MSSTRDASSATGMGGAELDRVVLITGAGSGIGVALARRIAAPPRNRLQHPETREKSSKAFAKRASCSPL